VVFLNSQLVREREEEEGGLRMGGDADIAPLPRYSSHLVDQRQVVDMPEDDGQQFIGDRVDALFAPNAPPQVRA